MITNHTKKPWKNLIKYVCEKCDYVTSDKRDYRKHLSTNKHKIATNDNEKLQKVYLCNCGKKYKYASGLSCHKKKCGSIISSEVKRDEKCSEKCEDICDELTDTNYKEMFLEMMHQNKELQNIIKELIPKVGNNNGNNNGNIIVNNTVDNTVDNIPYLIDYVHLNDETKKY